MAAAIAALAIITIPTLITALTAVEEGEDTAIEEAGVSSGSVLEEAG